MSDAGPDAAVADPPSPLRLFAIHPRTERRFDSADEIGDDAGLVAVGAQIPSCYCLAQRPGASSLAGVKQFRQWLIAEIARHKRTMRL